ncbi:MAG: NAD(P)-dependent oxidoreductase [Betaproteobacteria bacterium]|nr:NAD(P)-dependent oxidoreductase [Betaproteobacteria bacterium]
MTATKTTASKTTIGWIGAGRMGYEMAGRLAKGGADIRVWNRTRAKAEPLAQYGAKIVDKLTDLAGCDILFCMVATWDDVKQVIAGPGGVLSDASRKPRMVIECSSISLEGSAELREILSARGIDYLAAPVSGNAKVIKAGRLSFVCSGPKAAFDQVQPFLKMIAPAASYVGEGELARIVKICHNVFLGVVAQSLSEITILAQKAGVPRHAFLDFMNQSVMGSTFSRYKTPAFVNLDFKVTFTPYLLRKDLDLGLDAAKRFEVPMPLASITRDMVQSMMGRGMTEQDFAMLLVQQAEASGVKLVPENVPVGDGLS